MRMKLCVGVAVTLLAVGALAAEDRKLAYQAGTWSASDPDGGRGELQFLRSSDWGNNRGPKSYNGMAGKFSLILSRSYLSLIT